MGYNDVQAEQDCTPMPKSTPPNYRGLMLAAFLLVVLGGTGIFLLLNNTIPELGPRWLFYFLLIAASIGISLPFLWLLNRRFSKEMPPPPRIILREGLLFGLYIATCTWLQLNRVLTLTLALLLALGLFTIEWFLRLVERSRWRPGQ
jgi:hypothetical protein